LEWKAPKATQYGADLANNLLALLHCHLCHDSCSAAGEQLVFVRMVWKRTRRWS